MQLLFGDPFRDFSIEVIENQDADKINGAASDGDYQALFQCALRGNIESRPIRGQYSGHVISLDQSEASIQVT